MVAAANVRQFMHQDRLLLSQEALNEDEAAVRGLFSNSDGIATLIYDKLNLITDSVDGLIKARQSGLDALIKRANDSIERTERRLEQVEAGLVLRFANLEATLNLLQNQGNSLNSLSLFGTSRFS